MTSPFAQTGRVCAALALGIVLVASPGCGSSSSDSDAGDEASSAVVGGAPPATASTPTPAPASPPEPDPEGSLPVAYRELHERLESDDTLLEWKQEIVADELAPDPSPEATTVLLLATRNASIEISMASLVALSQRTDPRVEEQLVSLLGDPSWQRRAWSARLLGQSRRAGALGALRAQLEVESDPRVRRQLEEAASVLSETADARSAGSETSGTAGTAEVAAEGAGG